MAIKKISSYIVVVTALIVSMSACTKESDHESSGDIYISNPITGENFAGLKFEIIETETKYNSISSEVVGTNVICEGVTDQSGHADFSIRFKRKNRRLYSYNIEFDKSSIDAVSGQYYDDIPAFDVLHDGNYRKYEFHYLKYGNYVRQFKNVNCFDENDKIEFKVLEAYTGGYSNFDNIPFWGGGNVQYQGCIDWTQSIVNAPSNVYYYQLKVTRNGIDSIYYDTFVNNAGVTDTFKIFY